MEYAIFVVCGLVSFIGNLSGFGGGVFVVPLLVMVFDVPIEIAIGVTAISLFPSSLIASLSNWKNKAIDFKLIALLEPPTMIGAFIGALLTSYVSAKPLEIVFAAFLLFLSWSMFKKSRSAKQGMFSKGLSYLNDFSPHIKNRPYKVSFWAAGSLGTLSGIIAGFFGIGGGILKTPLMLNVFHVPVRVATGTAIGMIVITSFVSGLTHYNLGHVDFTILLPSMLGFVSGALASAWLGVKIQDQNILKIVTFSIFLAGIATLIHSFLPGL